MALKMSSVALILFTANSATAQQALSHADEVKLFASTMAIAKVVKSDCADIFVDDRYLEKVRRRLHIVEADHSAFEPVARAFADVLQEAQAETPDRQTWCDAVFWLYGPDDRLMRGMLRRR